MIDNPVANQIAKGRDIGRVNNPGNSFIWLECQQCHKFRWVFVRRTKMPTLCHHCVVSQSKSFSPEHRKNISLAKMGDKNPQRRFMGEKNRHWKGGRITRKDGYVQVYIEPDDFFYSMCTKERYVMEHRLVMAKHLSRCLLDWETVHHKNGIRNDNRIENLELITLSAQHTGITKVQTYIKKLERRIQELEANTKKSIGHKAATH